MPRTNRITCAGCDRQIDNGALHGCSNNLLRLFLSARALKKIAITDSVCRKCRSKFDNWIRKTKEDFVGFIEEKSFEKIMVNSDIFKPILSLILITFS